MMKLGTVLVAASALLMTAQPVMAESTRSASSLPSVSAPSKDVGVRRASKAGESEDIVGVPFLVLIAGIGLAVVVLDAAGVFNILGLSDS